MYCNLCEEDNPVEWDGKAFKCPNCGATLSNTRPKWSIEELPPKAAPKEPEVQQYACVKCAGRKVAENFLSSSGFITKYWNLDLVIDPLQGDLPKDAVACDMNCVDCYTVLSREAEMLFINERDALQE